MTDLPSQPQLVVPNLHKSYHLEGRRIAALLSPDSGSVRVAGLDPCQLPTSARERLG